MEPTPSSSIGGPLNGGGRSQLLPALLAEQGSRGFISREAATAIGRSLGIPLSEVYGVIEFYSLLSTQPGGDTVVHVCQGPVCRAKGSEQALERLNAELGIGPGEVEADGGHGLQLAPCLGLCDGAPAALVGARPVWRIDGGDASWIRTDQEAPLGALGGQPRRKSARCGRIDAADLDAFLADGGFQGLRRALFDLTPEAVIEEIKQSKLVGRGGAAFPTGLKWQYAATEPAPRYLVCNGDESEPGTFKDRVLMEGDPFTVLEGMAIAGFAIGAATGYLYVRGEYPRAQRTLAAAVQSARGAGYLGRQVMGTSFQFDIEIRSGAGAYICGEETALFESIEGKRGYPRMKPPFPTTHGLFGQPTVINNVETLCDVAWILTNGAAAHREVGTEGSAGTRLFCLSGDVAHPGVYEHPFGVRLGEVLAAAGGVQGPLQCVLLGGAAGAFVGPEQLDLSLSLEATRAAGLSLGSGAVMAFNESRPLVEILASIAAFFAHESCGKCLPCQLGTQRQMDMVERAGREGLSVGEQQALRAVTDTMTQASLCGLGTTAGVAVRSALDRWPQQFGPREGAATRR